MLLRGLTWPVVTLTKSLYGAWLCWSGAPAAALLLVIMLEDARENYMLHAFSSTTGYMGYR